MGLKKEYMVDKILLWNPSWDEREVLAWKPDQLYAIYCKERAKIVKSIMNYFANI